MPRHFAEAGELGIVSHGEYDKAIARREGVVGNDVRMCIAKSPGRRARGEIIRSLVGHHRQLHVEKRKVDVLPFALEFDVGEGALNCDDRIETCEEIRYRESDFHGLAPGFVVGLARYAHEASHSLDQEVVSRAVVVRARLSKTRDGAIDEPVVQLLEGFVVEPVALEPPRLEIFDQHVARLGELLHDLLALGLCEVHGDGAFATICTQEVGGVCGTRPIALLTSFDEGRPPAAGIVADSRSLDLDHGSAQVREGLRGPRPSEDATQFEHSDVTKRPCHGLVSSSGLMWNRVG